MGKKSLGPQCLSEEELSQAVGIPRAKAACQQCLLEVGMTHLCLSFFFVESFSIVGWEPLRESVAQ